MPGSNQGTSQRLIVVSNRLPVTVNLTKAGFTMRPSVGGLVTGVEAYLNKQKSEGGARHEYVWVGWPGAHIPADLQEEVAGELAAQHNAVPVTLSRELMDRYYFGFSNNTIWPLFHYFYVYTDFSHPNWDAYVAVNRLFAAEVARVARPGDTIWVHDYHLMLLPGMLREMMPDVRIGFFLHIPFPSFETFRLLPRQWAQAILEGLLGADLVGFHTHDYTQYFLRSVLRLIGHDHHLGNIRLQDRAVRVDTFPMGIEFSRYAGAATSPEAETEKLKLLRQLADRKVVLSVDRLDYTKGILNRLEAYRLFLDQHPEWHGRVSLVMVVVPSREGVPEYNRMKRSIDQTVGEINGRFSALDWTPILYQYRSLNLTQLCAAYAISDVALVTPLRDGMNLIAKEYLACCIDETGVLILSELAGAATELGEALLINPNNRQEVADAICTAITMPVEEQRARNRPMRDRLDRYDVVRWAEDFMAGTDAAWQAQRAFEVRIIAGELEQQIITHYRRAKRRLVITDYDGTLVGFFSDPLMAEPKDMVLDLLRRLAAQGDTDVALISGRIRETLASWLGSLDIHLSGEHGAYVRERGKTWKPTIAIDTSWKEDLRPLFEMASVRLPGAFIEEKDRSLVWHYRAAEPELGNRRALELMDTLMNYTANIDVQVLQGSRVVEVRSGKVNKGIAAQHFIDMIRPDFLLAVGDDWTDEDLFRAMPDSAYTIKVGLGATTARYSLRNHLEVLAFLGKLADAVPSPHR